LGNKKSVDIVVVERAQAQVVLVAFLQRDAGGASTKRSRGTSVFSRSNSDSAMRAVGYPRRLLPRLMRDILTYLLASVQPVIFDLGHALMTLQPLAWDTGFPERVVRLRKQNGWTQQQLAERVGVRMLQIRRYGSRAPQPTLDAIRRLALALGVTTDELIFDKDERGPDEELRLQLEAISRFDPEEKKIVEALLEGMILKHEAKRSSAA
jgi:transcriptional regulator with XRE-family HTH domain